MSRALKQLVSYLLVAVLLLTIATSARTRADSTGLNIEVSPLPILLNAAPGTSMTTDLRVRNAGTKPETLQTSIKVVDQEGPTGQIVIHDPGPNDTFVKWISFSKAVFVAPPGQWQTIKMTVDIPKDAAYGYYYAVQFSLANPLQAQKGTATLNGAVAIFVLLNAEAPGEFKKMEVTSFSADHQLYEFLPVNFYIVLRNVGNIHLAAHGNIFIKQGGSQVAALPINLTDALVLPHSNRLFQITWNDGFPVYINLTDVADAPVRDGRGNIKHKLSWNFAKISKLRFGHYQAELLMTYFDGQRDQVITGSLGFWIIPWRILLGLFVIVLLMIIGLWSIFKRFGKTIKRHIRLEKHTK